MKVPAPQPPVSTEPVNVPAEDLGDQSMEQPPMEEPTNNDNPFEKEKFDAGIDVDEDADPKTYVEKLTGKLAQKLRDFNETSQDIDLNKYVANSIISASVPSMTPEDAQDVIKKVKDNIGKEEVAQPAEPIEASPETEIPTNEPVAQPPKMEAKISVKKPIKESETIDELIEKLLRGEKTELKKSNTIKNKKPFGGVKFK